MSSDRLAQFHQLRHSEFGGIYLDRDVLVFKSLDPFRKIEMTLDNESVGNSSHGNSGLNRSQKGPISKTLFTNL